MFLKYEYINRNNKPVQKMLNFDNANYIEVGEYDGANRIIIGQSKSVNYFNYDSLASACYAYNQILNACENNAHTIILPIDGLVDVMSFTI